MTRVGPKSPSPQQSVQADSSKTSASQSPDVIESDTSTQAEDVSALSREGRKRRAEPDAPVAGKKIRHEESPPVLSLGELPALLEGPEGRRAFSVSFHKWRPDAALQMFQKIFPEFGTWLRGETAKPVAKGAKPPPGGFGGDGTQTPSQVMFGKDNGHLEMDRTMTSLISTYCAIVNEDFDAFTRAQKIDLPDGKLQRIDLPDGKLPRIEGHLETKSFGDIVDYFEEHLKTPEDRWTLIVATLVNDIGKMLRFRQLILRACDGVTDNHDLIAHLGISQWPELLPSFNELPEAQKETILAGLRMGVGLNVGQFAQCESTAYSLRSLTSLKGNLEHLHAKIMELLLDMFGALGHVDARGSKSCVELTWQTYNSTIPAMEKLVTSGDDSASILESSYNDHLKSVAKRLGYEELDPEKPQDHALIRLLGNGRCVSHDKAKPIAEAFYALQRDDADAFSKLVEEMNVSGLKAEQGMMLYWAPQTLENARNAIKREHGDANEEEISTFERDAFGEIFRAFAGIYDTGRKAMNGAGGPGMVEIEVKGLADYVTSADFVRNPKLLRQKAFKLLESGDTGLDWSATPGSKHRTDTAVCVLV